MTDNFDKALPYLEPLSVLELLRVHRWTLHKLHKLGAVRTFNPPQGDWAETLVEEAYGGELVEKSGRAQDVLVDKTSIQVKSRVLTQKGSYKSSSIRSWDFDKLVAVIFDTHDFGVLKATEFVGTRVRPKAHPQEHVNAESLDLNSKLMRSGTDITKQLQDAAIAVDRRLSKKRPTGASRATA